MWPIFSCTSVVGVYYRKEYTNIIILFVAHITLMLTYVCVRTYLGTKLWTVKAQNQSNCENM